jgi:acyl carrier protein
MTDNAAVSAVFSRMITPLAEQGLDLAVISPETRVADLDLDSLEMVTLAAALETEFGVELTDEEFLKCETLGDVAEMLAGKMTVT